MHWLLCICVFVLVDFFNFIVVCLLMSIFTGKMWIPLEEYPRVCYLNIPPYALYNPYVVVVLRAGTKLGYSSKGTQLFHLIFVVV